MAARIITLWLAGIFAAIQNSPANDEVHKTVIGFGSCAHQGRSQAFWDPILAHQPAYFIFGGDNIYSDTYKMDLQRKKYQQLAAQEGFQKLKKQSVLFAVWDDHDYGLNDSGAEFREKEGSRTNFLEFWGVPKRSARWQRAGTYDDHIVEIEGYRVQFIMLDTRYFRSPLNKLEARAEGGGRYGQNNSPDATILGGEQWTWLEKQLRKPAEIRLIVSSIQVVPQDHNWECWYNFPRERNRLFRLIKSTGANGVIFLTGDRHMAELSKHTQAGLGYPLYDLTSSGLNMGRGGYWPEPNRYRLGEQFFENNFGLVIIEWHKKDPVITLQVRDLTDRVVIEEVVPLSALRRRH